MNTNAKVLLKKTLTRIEGAYAPATIRAYKANFETFINFCEKHNIHSLPASAEDVAKFVVELTDGHLKSASIRTAVAAIATIHKLNSLPDPCEAPEVKIEMRRMHRKLGRYSKQAYAINSSTLQLMLKATDDSLRGIRDRAILQIAYDTLCRRSELVALRVEDIHTSKINGETNYRIRLRRSKTDQDANGRWLKLSATSQKYLQIWLKDSGITQGTLFRGVSPGGKITDGMNSGQINRIFKRIAKSINMPAEVVNRISGHSFRVGASQDLLLAGASLPMIMSRGRWSKTDTVMRYIESAGLQIA